MATTLEFDHQFIPAKKRSKKLMVVLHGRGDSLKSFLTFPNEMQIPEMNYLLLNAPRSYDTGFTWYAFPPKQKLGVLLARKKLFTLMRELEEQGYNLQDIYFLGFSQGSLVSCDFGLRFPQKLGGIICVSGYVYFMPRWKQEIVPAAYKQNWLMTHGIEDDALPIEDTKRDLEKLLEVKIPIRWHEFHKEHDIDPEIEIPLIRKWIRSTY